MDKDEKYIEIMTLIKEAINLLDESYENARRHTHIEWHVYEGRLERRTAFEKFRDENPGGKARHTHCDITFDDRFIVKFVTIDEIMHGVEFTGEDTVYLKSKFTKESAQKILSRMRG